LQPLLRSSISPGKPGVRYSSRKSGATTNLNQGISDSCTAKHKPNSMPPKTYGKALISNFTL